MRGDRMPYDAFDKLPKSDLDVPGGVIHVAFAPGDIALPKEKVLDWVKASARAVATYYGRYPVRELKLLIVPVSGPARARRAPHGVTRGAAIRVLLGREASEEDLRRDWVMGAERWCISRCPTWRSGTPGCPKGLPSTSNRSPGRRRSGGSRNLAGDDARHAGLAGKRRSRPRLHRHMGAQILGRRDVLPARRRRDPQSHRQQARPAGRHARRGISAGGNHEQDWPIERVLSTADKAVGVNVLTRLHNEMGAKPVIVTIRCADPGDRECHHCSYIKS